MKIVSDPAAGGAGGSIVGQHAAELISAIAAGVTAGWKVADLPSLFVHPVPPRRWSDAAD
ncbi:MAG: hypothetical protein R2702_08915 [Acidimicrobiales bacterium]